MPQIRRRQLLVDAKLQGSLLAHVAMYWIYCLLSVAVIALVWIVISKRPSTSADLFEQLWTNFGPALLGSIFLLPLVLLDCLRISNRLAGPLMRLRREMSALADGKPARPVRLRDGDFWREFAEDWNRVQARCAPAPVAESADAPPPPSLDEFQASWMSLSPAADSQPPVAGLSNSLGA